MKRKNTLTVAVLMGGPSEEYTISLKSGHGIADALARKGWNVRPVEIPHEQTIPQAIEWTRATLTELQPDVVFVALHGPFGEDGTIQQLCEEMQLAYTGSDVSASRTGMDKIVSRESFIAAGLRVPRWQALQASAPDVSMLSSFAYPLVVKPVDQGSSIGVSLVPDAAGLMPAIREAGKCGPTVLVEEFIKGRELTVGVLGRRALPVIEIVPSKPFFDFTAKYTAGMTEYHVPASLDPAVAERVQSAGIRAHRALCCRHFSRADFILDASGEPVVLEVNTIPGFTPTSLLPKAAKHVGISYDDLCEEIVVMALQDAAAFAPSLR